MGLRPVPRIGTVVVVLCLLAGCSAPPSAARSAWAPARPISVRLSAMNPAPSETPQAMDFLPGGVGAVSLANCLGKACRGELLRTSDFGANWRTVPTGTPPFIGIRVFSKESAVAWTQTAVYTTGDGGSAWSRVYEVAPGPTLSAAFSSPQEGYVAVNGPCATRACAFDLYRTTDGGSRWTKVGHDNVVPGRETTPPNLPSAMLALTAVTSGGTVIVTSEAPFSQVLVSTDGGRTFNDTLSGLGQGTGRLSVSMAGGGQGWAIKLPICAAPGCRPLLYHSLDAGRTWTYVRELQSDASTELYAAADGALWASVGTRANAADCDPCAANIGPLVQSLGGVRPHALPGGEPPIWIDPISVRSALALGFTPGGYVLWRTTQGGTGWTRVASFFKKPFPQTLGMWNSRSGWAMGPAEGGEALLRTSDGAHTWQTVTQVPGGYADTAGLLDAHVGWVFAPGGWLITTDGGRIWTKAPLPKGFVFTVGLQTARIGFAVAAPTKGAMTNLYITENRGRTWSLAKSDVQMAAFAPGRVIYAVTRPYVGRSTLWISPDLGRTWRSTRLPPAMQPTSMGVAPDNTLWLFGGDQESTLWVSGDAGRRFETVTFPGAQVFPPPAIVSLHTWYALLGDGIYRTNDGGRSWKPIAASPMAPAPGSAP